jgi:hypothetical protein
VKSGVLELIRAIHKAFRFSIHTNRSEAHVTPYVLVPGVVIRCYQPRAPTNPLGNGSADRYEPRWGANVEPLGRALFVCNVRR